MFLYQKLGYKTKRLDSEEDVHDALTQFKVDTPKIVGFDTETTGLNYMKDVPFLLVFGWDKKVFGVDMFQHPDWVATIRDALASSKWLFAHNAKYDYHMMLNSGNPLPDTTRLADSQTIARLTNYADDMLNKGLADLGTAYVDPTAKFASKVIKEKLNKINATRRNTVKAVFKSKYPDANWKDVWEQYEKRVAYVAHEYDEMWNYIDLYYTPANYYDVYAEHPNLMLSYAYDDIVIMLEYIGKAIPVLKTTDPELRTFKRECDLLIPSSKHERIGLLVDVKYMLGARERVILFREKLYKELRELTGIPTLTANQHQVIAKLFDEKYNVPLEKVTAKSLMKINREGAPMRVARLIKRLRTVDKWLSTYIDGMLNRMVDGRLYSSVDLSGAVSGRVSSNMQQQPKYALYDEENNELFHPRQAIITDEDYKLFFFDYSQQELRVQAYYTLLTASGDTKLLRAFMPYKCSSILTGEDFDYKNPELIARWNSGEWMDEDGKMWVKLDVHTETTLTAFPGLKVTDEHFDEYRKKGKMCNFLKNYQGGIDAIIEQLDVTEEVAKILDKAYYDTFPVIKDYQRWVTKELTKVGFVTNLYGRRYYMRNASFFYKCSNYLIQGSSADMVKSVELRVAKLLEGTKSSFIMPVHDEIIVRIHDSEQHLIKQIKDIMEDIPEVPWVPMVSDVEWTDTNWAEKHKWKE